MDRDFDFSLKATGDVYPCRFVKLDTSSDGDGAQAGANDRTVGISGDQTKYAPGMIGGSTKLAESGDTIPVFGTGRKCLLELGGTVARGGRVIADANGKGVASATTGTTIQEVGALCLQSGVSGQKVLVLIEQYPYRPALS